MDRVLISPIDFILVPVYCFLLYLFSLYKKKKNPDNPLIQRYYVKGFMAKLAGSIFLGLLIYYYYGFGDTVSYYRESLIMRDLVSENKISFFSVFTEDYDYFRDTFDLQAGSAESGFMVEKISFLLSYFSFSRFLLTGCLLTSLSYFGIFKLYETFVSLAPERHKFIAFIVLLFPTVVIYGSGVFKDPITLSALGWLFHTVYQVIQRKKITISNILILLSSFWIILIIKSYIIAAFIVPLLFSMAMKTVKNIRYALIKIIIFPTIIILITTAYFAFSAEIDQMLGAFAVEKLAESIQGQQKGYAALEADAGSNFEIGEVNPTMAGIAKQMPIGMVATLYRPFLWEVKKPIIAATALESIFILFFTLYTIFKTGVLRFFKLIFTDSDIFLCIIFSLLFSGLVGISTPNFGTLARYRIPVIPFYLFGILLILRKGMAEKLLKISNGVSADENNINLGITN